MILISPKQVASITPKQMQSARQLSNSFLVQLSACDKIMELKDVIKREPQRFTNPLNLITFPLQLLLHKFVPIVCIHVLSSSHYTKTSCNP